MQSNTAKGTEYEKFVQAIYQEIVDNSGVENIEVKHNVSLGGRSGADHQIDIF
ncbi:MULTISPECIES: hypothetical protein [unclassified Pseudovibrio]|uniref:hypothetical protein n=1 Tax=unclassified Pseudovibrio TaxID=2627060 RepID=UPI0007B1854D|nr:MULTISPECIES: hypothetical protein [unclassified Pseudovibrio]KZK94445.1 hypothetical protein PsW74_04587 [Pseudovibrio sp. W74]KZL07195.1 hypothetical protein PsAD14_04210 [Pseudovibrio sp. Ad14]